MEDGAPVSKLATERLIYYLCIVGDFESLPAVDESAARTAHFTPGDALAEHPVFHAEAVGEYILAYTSVLVRKYETLREGIHGVGFPVSVDSAERIREIPSHELFPRIIEGGYGAI